MKTLLHFLVAYALLDLVWLNLFAKNFMQRQVGQYMAAKANLTAAAIF